MAGHGNIAQRIAQAFGSPVEGLSPLSGSYGLSLDVVRLGDGRRLVAKHGAGPRPDHLEIEAFMLRELERKTRLPVPHVHLAEPDLLVMDHVAGSGGGGASVERHMAELLADLHSMSQPHFGYERNTTIGPLPQPNPPTASWIDFFREQRLLFMARLAHERAGLPSSLLERIERFAERLEDHIDEPSHPALIHGDIWGGNVIINAGRVAAFIDPAIYNAHPEIELAFMTMFGTAGRAFFDAYAALMPDFDAKGFFETRRDIYLIYPHLTHVLICGLSYASGIDSRLARLGF